MSQEKKVPSVEEAFNISSMLYIATRCDEECRERISELHAFIQWSKERDEAAKELAQLAYDLILARTPYSAEAQNAKTNAVTDRAVILLNKYGGYTEKKAEAHNESQ